MKFSLMALNRQVEERVAFDIKYRNEIKKTQPVLSDGRALPDDALVEKLRAFGLEVDRAWLGEALQPSPSAQHLATQLAKPGVAGSGHEHWLWIGLTCLWERWFPDQPNFEMIDDGIHECFRMLEEEDVSSKPAPRFWMEVWRGVLHLMHRCNFRTINEFDEQFAGTHSLLDWLSSFSYELQDVDLADAAAFNNERLAICGPLLELAERSEDRELARQFKRGLAEAHADLRDYETVNRLFAEWLDKDPCWGWGWVDWSDAFFLFAPAGRKNAARAEEILLKGLAVPDVTEADAIVERLVSIYAETGRTAELTALTDRYPELIQSRSLSSELVCTNETDLDTVLAVLDRPYSGVLPETALRQAQRRREEITPRLIDMLRNATAEIRAGRKVPSDGSLFAQFLLAEFKSREALPAIIEAISLPDEGPFDLFGDAIFDELPGILAALVDAPQTLDALIANQSVDGSVRMSAAAAYLYLVRDGRLSRDEAVERLRDLLRQALAELDEDGATAVVMELDNYSPHEALDDIQEAYRRSLVDEDMIDLEYIKESIADGEAGFQQALEDCPPTGIEDTVEELRDWASFREDAKGDGDFDDDDEDDFADEDEDDFDGDEEDDGPFSSPAWKSGHASSPAAEPSITIRNTEPHVGRNDPCPCGSGKKYKKCCGAN